MGLLGIPFEVAGGLLSLGCGAVAVVLVYALLRQSMSSFASAAAIAALCAFPTAPVLQVAYSESLTLLVLVLTLWTLRLRRYGFFAVFVVILAFSRPIAPPLLLVLIVHWIGRWRHEGPPRMARDWVIPTATVAVTATSTFLWPFTGWLSTGEPRAFFATQETWRLSAHDSFLSAGVLGQLLELSWHDVALVVAPVAVCCFVALRRSAARWGTGLRAWVVIYPLYILLATQPTNSVMRYLMLALVPWWPLPAATVGEDQSDTRKLLRWGLLALILSLELVLQYYWVLTVFTIDVSPAMQGFP
jgi:hypothetical protein